MQAILTGSKGAQQSIRDVTRVIKVPASIQAQNIFAGL